MPVYILLFDGDVRLKYLTTWLTDQVTNSLTNWLNYSTKQSSPSEACNFSGSQECPRILWNPEVHYLIHNILLLIAFLSQINPVQAQLCTICLRSTLILSSHLSLKFPSGNFAAFLPAKPLYKFLFSHVAATKKNKVSDPITWPRISKFMQVVCHSRGNEFGKLRVRSCGYVLFALRSYPHSRTAVSSYTTYTNDRIH